MPLYQLMSAVSSSVGRQPLFFNPTVVLNIILACLCAGGLAFYIASVNGNASDEYHISYLRSEVARLSESQGVLSAEKSAMENPASAASFAQSRNMIEAKDIMYVFENGNVALQR